MNAKVRIFYWVWFSSKASLRREREREREDLVKWSHFQIKAVLLLFVIKPLLPLLFHLFTTLPLRRGSCLIESLDDGYSFIVDYLFSSFLRYR